MATVIGIREEKKTSNYLRNYKVSDLLDKIDVILTERGFSGLGDGIDVETGGMYRVYKRFNGEAVVRFVTDKSKLIQYFSGGKEVARCPIYVELLQVPNSINKSIFNDLKKI